MSADSLAQLAVDRDRKQPGELIKTSTEALAAVIPTEALAAYTALVGISLAVVDEANRFVPFRWIAYLVFVLLAGIVPFVMFRCRLATDMSHRRFPARECLTAAFAAAAWGAVMPEGPLSLVLGAKALTLAVAAIVLGATMTLSLIAQFLGTANDLNPAGAEPSETVGSVAALAAVARVASMGRVGEFQSERS